MFHLIDNFPAERVLRLRSDVDPHRSDDDIERAWRLASKLTEARNKMPPQEPAKRIAA